VKAGSAVDIAAKSDVEPYWHTMRQVAAFGGVLIVSLIIAAALFIGVWLGIRQLISMTSR
jgi:hypothetical protein